MQYISAHPEEHILVNTMRVAHPQPTDNRTHFNVMVQNDIQLNTMHRAMPQLIAALRDALDNDSVVINVTVNQDIDNPMAWNDREVFAKMMEAHPMLREMAQRFKLNIS